MWYSLDFKVPQSLSGSSPIILCAWKKPPSFFNTNSSSCVLDSILLFQHFQMFLSLQSPSYPQRKLHKSPNEWGLGIGKSLVSPPTPPPASLQSQACQEWCYLLFLAIPPRPLWNGFLMITLASKGSHLMDFPVPQLLSSLTFSTHWVFVVLCRRSHTNGHTEFDLETSFAVGLGWVYMHVFSQVPTLPIRILHTKIGVSSFSGKIIKMWQSWTITISQQQSIRSPGQLPPWDQARASPVTTVLLGQLHSHRL